MNVTAWNQAVTCSSTLFILRQSATTGKEAWTKKMSSLKCQTQPWSTGVCTILASLCPERNLLKEKKEENFALSSYHLSPPKRNICRILSHHFIYSHLDCSSESFLSSPTLLTSNRPASQPAHLSVTIALGLESKLIQTTKHHKKIKTTHNQ